MRKTGELDLRFLVSKGSGAARRWYWQPPAYLQPAGWRTARLAADVADPVARQQAAERAADARNQALAAPDLRSRLQPTANTVTALVRAYRASRFFRELAAKTRRDYEQCLALIEAWAGDEPAAAIDAQDVEQLYSSMRPTRPAMAAATIRVVRLVWNAAPRIPGAPRLGPNPAEKPHLKGARPRPRIWSRGAVAAMVAGADALGWHSLGTAIVLDEWLGQREGDVLALPRELDLAGDLIVEQRKTNAVAPLPISIVPALMARRAAELAAQAARGVTSATHLLLSERTGQPWDEHAFRHVLAAVREQCVVVAFNAGFVALARELDTLQFRHLRHTAITRLAEAGVDTKDIAAITGHSLATVNQILEHYLVRTRKLARRGFAQRLAAEAEGNGRD